MLIISLSRGGQLHRHTEAIGMASMRKLVFCRNIAPGAKRKNLGLCLGSKGG